MQNLRCETLLVDDPCCNDTKWDATLRRSSKIAPLKSIEDWNKDWIKWHLQLLSLILETGKCNPEPVYSCPKKAWFIFTLTACTSSCCLPCCLWDTSCLLFECIHKHKFRYGCYLQCLVSSCEELHKTKKQEWSMYAFKPASHSCVIDVCKQYLIEFDCCVSKKTIQDAKKANIIREVVVNILQNNGYSALVDDGDIDKLRNIVYTR